MTHSALKAADREIPLFYRDNTIQHDRPVITSCSLPGLASAAGLNLSSATEERDLDMILANIALAYEEGRPLSYSRNKNHVYRDITVGRVLSSVAKIESAGLAVDHRRKPGQRGWQSDVRCTPALAEIFEKFGHEPVYGPRDPIILRSRRDRSLLLPMKPPRELLRQVERLNEMLRSTDIGLDMTGALMLKNGLWLFERLEEDQFGNPRLAQQRLRLDPIAGRRVFTSDHKRHGRFYCPAQNIPSTARLQMTLNGRQVVELDFVSMHISLAYSQCGARLEGDPYVVPGFTRRQGKMGLLAALNARTFQAALAALTDNRSGKAVLTSRTEAQRLLEALKGRHAPIEKMLCSDAGMRLMYLDARIMLASVDRLISKGIHCIPIHDSIVVPAQYEGEARDALNFGWYSQNPEVSPCNIEKKRQNSLQDGWEPWGELSGSLLRPLDPGSGWWSSVLAEARYDVAEWCA